MRVQGDGATDQGSRPRVVRGGSWINNPGNLRCAYRNRNDPENRDNNLGFRVLCRLFSEHVVGPTSCRWRRVSNGPSLSAPTSSESDRRGWLLKSFRALDEILSLENIWGAWRDFERGKRRRPAVATFGMDADQLVLRLFQELNTGTWYPGGYRLLRICDPKRRIVAAAPVADRVVHHAIHRVLAPRLNRRFIDQSYACLPNRGSHRAILRFASNQRHFKYVLHLDIRRYFYQVDREQLRALLWKRLPEPGVRMLLDRILESGADLYRDPRVVSWLGWDEPAAPGRGLPIGNLTSQWWGNLYLDEMDHFACRTLRMPAFLRYMDDFAIFSDDRDQLLRTRDQVAQWLREKRGLELKNPSAGPLRCDRHHTWLGYQISRTGISPGKRMCDRMHKNLNRHIFRPARMRCAVASIAAAWMFG